MSWKSIPLAYVLMLLRGKIFGRSEWRSMECAFARGRRVFSSISVIIYYLFVHGENSNGRIGAVGGLHMELRDNRNP